MSTQRICNTQEVIILIWHSPNFVKYCSRTKSSKGTKYTSLKFAHLDKFPFMNLQGWTKSSVVCSLAYGSFGQSQDIMSDQSKSYKHCKLMVCFYFIKPCQNLYFSNKILRTSCVFPLFSNFITLHIIFKF